jgi:SAM-dependent methyltransferase
MRISRALLRLQRRTLQRLYGFDDWHVGHANETYVADVVRYLNARAPSARASAVEIGCGTGDIIRRLRFGVRLGLDADPNVLAAARLLAALGMGTRPRFEVFEFPTNELTGVHDAIVMVNWIHLHDSGTLGRAIASYFKDHLRPGGVLVLDTVADPAYTYNHDVKGLAPAGATAHHVGRYPRNRDVWALLKGA